jgi:TonB family protein
VATISPSPQYPASARELLSQGKVVFLLAINASGDIDAIRLLRGNPIFDQAAYDAVKTWKFTPATANGKPVSIVVSVECVFGSSDGNGANRDAAQFTASAELHPFLPVATSPPAYKVTAPRVIYAPDPSYPEDARRAGTQGVVYLHLTVGTDGKTHDITVKRGLSAGLNEAAIQAVRRWRFQPATKDGQQIPVEVDIQVSFNLPR